MIKKIDRILLILGILLILFILKPCGAKAAGKYDLIIIGDSLTSQMCGLYTGVYGSNSATINGKSVMMLGAGGEGHDYWFEQHYQEVKNALNNAKNGATCVIYLGGNDYWEYNKYVTSLNKMATEYTNVNFYFCSYPHSNTLTGKPRVSYNKDLDNLNDEVLNGLKKVSRFNKNLFYKEINNKELQIDGITKTLDHFIMDDTKYIASSDDPDHLSGSLYKAICEQIFLKMTKGSSSGTGNSSSGSSRRSSASYSIGVASNETGRQEVAFNDVLEDKDYYSDVGDLDQDSKEKVEKTVGKILAILTNIGIVVSILMPAFIGIKYMILGKMESKRDLVPYFVGGVMLFAICIITKIVLIMGRAINSI